MSIRRKLIVTTALSAFASATAWDRAVAAPARDVDATAVEQLVVTARKREENLGDTPISGSVISSEISRDLVLDNTADIVRQLPATSLVVSGAESIGDISMRGQGVGRLGSSESTTGLYRNGISVAGGSFFGKTFSRLDLFDLERIESFRGPQGALYGRNAVGGSINIVSRHPTDSRELGLKLGYRTEVDEKTLEAIFNEVAIPDLLDMRLGVIGQTQKGGFYKRAEDGAALDGTDMFGARGAAKLRVGQGDFTVTLEHLYSEGLAAGILGYSPDSGDPDPYTRKNLTTDPISELRENTAFAEFNQPTALGDFSLIADFKERRGTRNNEDIDHVQGLGSTGADVRGDQWNRYDRAGVEARLASKPGSGRWSWLVGADAQTSWEKQRTTQNIFFIPTSFTAGKRAVINALNNDRQVEDDLTSYSAFGLVGYDITPKWQVTLETRVQHDEKAQRGINFRPTATTVTAYERKRKFTEWTPVATLAWRPWSGQNFYARYATGYRPGGFNDALLFLGASSPGTSYDVESDTSYELGWKADLLDRRLHVEADVFRTHTRNVQLVTRDPESGTTAATLLNAGNSNIWGGELSVNGVFHLGPGRLNLIFSLSGQNGEFTDGSGVLQASGFLDLSGARVPRTRDYMTNLTLSYTQPIGGSGWRWNGTASARAEGGGYENLAGGAKVANSKPLASFEVVDLRTSVFNGRWRISAFIKNATDERYRTQALSNLTGSANFPGTRFTTFWNEPRSAGVEVSVDY